MSDLRDVMEYDEALKAKELYTGLLPIINE